MIITNMNNEDFFRDLHKKFKKDYVLREFVNPKEVDEYQCYFKLIVDSNKTEAGLEDILIFIRGINGVTIVRTAETTKRNEAGRYSTRLQVKYTPQTFNRGVSLEQVYKFLESEIRKFGPSVSLSRLTPPPGKLVSGDK